MTALARQERSCLLTINGGSSSLKFAIYPRGESEGQRAPGHEHAPALGRPLCSGRIERVGTPEARARVDLRTVDGTDAGADANANASANADGPYGGPWPVEAPDLGAAAEWLIAWVDRATGWPAIAGLAHRVVHGGPRHYRPERITPELLSDLRRLVALDPDHLPGELDAIERFLKQCPDLPQVACFDTAFHHDLPPAARVVPLPRRFQALGIRRYGFHGLSFEYLMRALEAADGPELAAGRVVLAHLGNGASLAAVRDHRPIETTMGLTPSSGLVMSTRCGDIDPGLPGFLAREQGTTIEEFDAIVNHQSGLLGISETSGDVRDLLAHEDQAPRAAEALAVFVHHVKKSIGALAAALGGLDALVFSGGIGENAPAIRQRVCNGLEFLGLQLDAERNAAGAPLVSADTARTRIRVVPTDEESILAEAIAKFLSAAP